MEDGGGGEHETWEPLWSAQCSPATSSAGSPLRDELDDDTVFVAVPEEVGDGRSILLWALHNLVEEGSKVVVVHVHSPALAMAQIRDHNSMKPEEIKKYRDLKRAKAEKNLDAYLLIAKYTREDLEVDSAKVIIERDSVVKGLEELIALHNITKLVMGAAADQHFSNWSQNCSEMNAPKSKTTLKLMETAAASCKIWFTCKGNLIRIREVNEKLPAIPPSPGKSNAPVSPAHNISSQMGSMALTELEYEVSNSKGYTSSSLVATEMTNWDYLFGGDCPKYIWNDKMPL
ncbi:hypothetical protein U9M48_022497 [Paspalum notatum var. saurae]|uniref:RING-type E3 ubiquitin transferase n=1 Tax=Paspalum notatum var. saurae TaxID=547442 RepID=A0AAQ3WU20_PASNO